MRPVQYHSACIYVRERDRASELARVSAAEGDLAVVLLVLEAGDFEGGDCVVDESGLGERLDGGQGLLLGEGLRKEA